MNKKNNRFDALKGDKKNVFTSKDNNFINKGPPEKVNSRWQRDDDDVRTNTFKRERGYRGGRRGGRGGRRGGRGYRGNRKKSELFHGKERDMFGAPMIKGATQRGLNLNNLEITEKPKNKKEKKKKDKKRTHMSFDNNIIEKTDKEKEDESNYNKKLALEYQMETDSEDEIHIICDICKMEIEDPNDFDEIKNNLGILVTVHKSCL